MNQKPRAIIVSVDFADLLAITLPYNRHHFSEVVVVTSHADKQSQKVARKYGARTYATDVFYDSGAVFNKHKPLEDALTSIGRWGWICLLDVDILWPKKVPYLELDSGCIYGAKRRILSNAFAPIPEDWSSLPIYLPSCRLFAGCTQLFHAGAACLGPPPWHSTNWRHAGGADSEFQQKWPREKRIWMPFEVLHLGEVGINWCGRVLPYQDGDCPKQGGERMKALASMVKSPGIPRRGPHERIPSDA